MGAIPVVVDDQDQLPEELSNYYSETDDGRFVLDVDGVDSHPNVVNLKNAYQREKEKRQRLAQERDKLNQRAELIPEEALDDLEPETIQQAIERLRSGEEPKGQQGQGQDKGQHDAAQIKAQVEKRFQKEIEQRDQQLQSKDEQIRQLVVHQSLRDALSQAKVSNPVYQKAAMRLLADQVQVQEADDGLPRAVVETDMGEMDVASYVQQWTSTDEGAAFVDGNTGGDARGSSRNSSGTRKREITREQFNQMSPAEAKEFFANGGRIAS